MTTHRVRAALARLAQIGQGAVFGLFGFAVRIHPTFWVCAIVLGIGGSTGVLDLATWVLVVLVSILAHELGHAIVAARRGVVYRITLHGAGGETSWRPLGADDWRHRVLVALAGPASGFVLAAAAWLLIPWIPLEPATFALYRVLVSLFLVNLVWGIFNLLPLLPLDGGHVVETLADRWAPAWSPWLVPLIGTATAALGMVWAIGARQMWTVLVLLFFGFQSASTLKMRLTEMRDARRRTAWGGLSPSERERERYRRWG